MKKASNILLLLTTVWCAAIVTTPLLAAAGGVGGNIASVVYKLFGAVCHQFESRAFHIEHHPFAVCVRCSSIYFGFLLGVVTLRFWKPKTGWKNGNRLILPMVLLPMFLDVILSFIGLYESTTASRLITGGIFGAGMSLFLYDSLIEAISILLQQKITKYEFTPR